MASSASKPDRSADLAYPAVVRAVEIVGRENARQAISSRCISLAGKTTLRELLVLYSLAAVLVTIDYMGVLAANSENVLREMECFRLKLALMGERARVRELRNRQISPNP